MMKMYNRQCNKKIYLFPDYHLEVNGRFAWTLEARAR